MPTIRQIRSSVAYRALCRTVKREEHTCWLCGQPIDPTIPFRDPHTHAINPKSWSLDHIAPISKHPELALIRDNCRAAHYGCNSARKDRAPKQINNHLTTSRQW